MMEINNERSYEELAAENWDRMKDRYPGVYYLKGLKDRIQQARYQQTRRREEFLLNEGLEYIPLSRLSEVPSVELEFNDSLLKKGVRECQELAIPWFSIDLTGDTSDWFPYWVRDVAFWALGSGLGEFDVLGVDLIRLGREDLLRVLEQVGDHKAKFHKKRSKMPRVLVGKTLEWEQQDETTWIVHVVKRIEICKYHKIFEKWKWHLEADIDWDSKR